VNERSIDLTPRQAELFTTLQRYEWVRPRQVCETDTERGTLYQLVYRHIVERRPMPLGRGHRVMHWYYRLRDDVRRAHVEVRHRDELFAERKMLARWRRQDRHMENWIVYGGLYSPMSDELTQDLLMDDLEAEFGPRQLEAVVITAAADAAAGVGSGLPACPRCASFQMELTASAPEGHRYACPVCQKLRPVLFVCTDCFAYQCRPCTPVGSLTLEQTGVVLEVERQRAWQIQMKALRKLRHPSRSNVLKPFVVPELTSREVAQLELAAPRTVNWERVGQPRVNQERVECALAHIRARLADQGWSRYPRLTTRSGEIAIACTLSEQSEWATAVRSEVRLRWPEVAISIDFSNVSDPTPKSRPTTRSRWQARLPPPPPEKPKPPALVDPWRDAEKPFWVFTTRPRTSEVRRMRKDELWDPTHILRIQQDGYIVLVAVHAVMARAKSTAPFRRWVMLYRRSEWGDVNWRGQAYPRWVFVNDKIQDTNSHGGMLVVNYVEVGSARRKYLLAQSPSVHQPQRGALEPTCIVTNWPRDLLRTGLPNSTPPESNYEIEELT
jgi:hypothetical protein